MSRILPDSPAPESISLLPEMAGLAGGGLVFHEGLDIVGTVENLIRTYGQPIVGTALILGGMFLRLIGRGIAFLILGLGIAVSSYVAFVQLPPTADVGIVYGMFLAALASSATLALAFNRLTAAFAFGFFVGGWFLLLNTTETASAFLFGGAPGASTWAGLSIGTTILAELLAKRLRRRHRRPVPAVAPIASAVRGLRR